MKISRIPNKIIMLIIIFRSTSYLTFLKHPHLHIHFKVRLKVRFGLSIICLARSKIVITTFPINLLFKILVFTYILYLRILRIGICFIFLIDFQTFSAYKILGTRDSYKCYEPIGSQCRYILYDKDNM